MGDTSHDQHPRGGDLEGALRRLEGLVRQGSADPGAAREAARDALAVAAGPGATVEACADQAPAEWTIRLPAEAPACSRERIAIARVSISLAFAALDGTAALARCREERDSTLQDLREKLVRADKLAAIGELVSGVAHELNNPLATVIGYAELLTRGGDVSTTRGVERLTKIQKEAERSRRLVQNLLRFVRKEAPRRDPLDFAAVTKDVIELRDYAFRCEGVPLENDLPHDLPRVLGDPSALQQVVFNLLNNAFDATKETPAPRGAVRLTLRREGENALALEVSDHGIGIPEEALPRLFDAFFTTKPVGKGTGLGLSLSAAIVKDHGGEIRVSTTRGAGSVFTVVLPVAPAGDAAECGEAGAAAAAGALAAAAAARAAEEAAHRVLLIDDEPFLREMLVDFLADRGFSVEATADGHEALRWLEAGRGYDLVISDLKMPTLTGDALWERLKERRPDLAPRLIFISGDSVSEHTRGFLRAAARPLLRKPFALDRLEGILGAVARGEAVASDLGT